LAQSYEAAEHFAREAIAIAPANLRELRMYACATLARVLLATKRVPEALVVAREAKAVLDKFGSPTESGALAGLAYAEALHASGDHDGARAVIAEARDSLIACAGRIGDAELRKNFLEDVPANSKTMKLAAEWCATP
jgi:hypothetical protein